VVHEASGRDEGGKACGTGGPPSCGSEPIATSHATVEPCTVEPSTAAPSTATEPHAANRAEAEATEVSVGEGLASAASGWRAKSERPVSHGWDECCLKRSSTTPSKALAGPKSSSISLPPEGWGAMGCEGWVPSPHLSACHQHIERVDHQTHISIRLACAAGLEPPHMLYRMLSRIGTCCIAACEAIRVGGHQGWSSVMLSGCEAVRVGGHQG
jgi:hypothetical protein